MKKYKVYYIFNSKKYKSTIEAESASDARRLVREKIKILEVQVIPESKNHVVDDIMNMFGKFK